MKIFIISSLQNGKEGKIENDRYPSENSYNKPELRRWLNSKEAPGSLGGRSPLKGLLGYAFPESWVKPWLLSVQIKILDMLSKLVPPIFVLC